LFCQNYQRTEKDDTDDPVGLPKRTHLGRLAGYGQRKGFRALHVGVKGRRPDFVWAHLVTLQHIELVDPWVEEHKSFVEQKFIDLGRSRKKGDVTREHNSSFTAWFKEKLHGL
jgi:hypothetical protein